MNKILKSLIAVAMVLVSVETYAQQYQTSWSSNALVTVLPGNINSTDLTVYSSITLPTGRRAIQYTLQNPSNYPVAYIWKGSTANLTNVSTNAVVAAGGLPIQPNTGTLTTQTGSRLVIDFAVPSKGTLVLQSDANGVGSNATTKLPVQILGY